MIRNYLAQSCLLRLSGGELTVYGRQVVLQGSDLPGRALLSRGHGLVRRRSRGAWTFCNDPGLELADMHLRLQYIGMIPRVPLFQLRELQPCGVQLKNKR